MAGVLWFGVHHSLPRVQAASRPGQRLWSRPVPPHRAGPGEGAREPRVSEDHRPGVCVRLSCFGHFRVPGSSSPGPCTFSSRAGLCCGKGGDFPAGEKRRERWREGEVRREGPGCAERGGRRASSGATARSKAKVGREEGQGRCWETPMFLGRRGGDWGRSSSRGRCTSRLDPEEGASIRVKEE